MVYLAILIILVVLIIAAISIGGVSPIKVERMTASAATAGRPDSSYPCNDCDMRMLAQGHVILNPYLYPYSTTSCIDDLYSAARSSNLNIGIITTPPTHLNTPDNVEFESG